MEFVVQLKYFFINFPLFYLPYVSCDFSTISTILEITKTLAIDIENFDSYGCDLKLTDVKIGLISSVISNDVRFFQLSGLQVFDAFSQISGQFKLIPHP